MGKDWKGRDQRGRCRDEKDKDGKENDDEDKTNNLGYWKGIDEKEDSLRSDRVVIRSCPTKATRITPRGIKTKHIESRPPWNTGSPSPTNIQTSAAQAKRSIRALAQKLQNRPNVHGQEEPVFSPNLKGSHQDAVSKAEPPQHAPSPQPTNLCIPPQGPKIGLEWEYEKLDEFLQHATGTITLPRTKYSPRLPPINQSSLTPKDRFVDQISAEVGIQHRQNTDTASTDAAPTEVLRHAIKLSHSFGKQVQEDSFFESELMGSPQPKIAMSSPTSITVSFDNQRITQTSIPPNSKTSEQTSLDDKLANERRRAHILAILARGENQNMYLTPTQAEPDLKFQLSQEPPDEQAFAWRITQSTPMVPKSQRPSSGYWPASPFQLDPDASDDEQCALRPVIRLVSNSTEVPSPGSNAYPATQLQPDPQTLNKEYASPQPEHYLPSTIKVPCLGSSISPMPQLQLDLESAGEEQRAPCLHPQNELDQLCLADKQPATQQVTKSTQRLMTAQCSAPSGSELTSAQITREDSPIHADGESSEEDCALKWRSVMNRDRRLRRSKNQSPIKSVKWDPAIIACGPVTAALPRPSLPNFNALPEVCKADLEKSELEDSLEIFRKTISQLKKGDRKSIQKLLGLLKNLDSDEDSVAKPRKEPKKQTKQPNLASNTTPRRGLNPLAPVFRESSQKAQGEIPQKGLFLNVRRKRPHSLQDNEDEGGGPNETAQTWKPTPCATRSYQGPLVPEVCKQEPIWINTFQQSPTVVLDQGDEDFQEFCKVNNFTPIIPVTPNPFTPIAPPDPFVPFLAPYLSLMPDPKSFTYTLPLDDMQPISSTVGTYLAELAEKAPGATLTKVAPIAQQYYLPTTDQEFGFTLEETPEPIEDVEWREAQALDPAWGAQIMEHFLRKYPMTGQRKPAVTVSEQNENRKHAEKGQRKLRRKVDQKAPGGKAHIKRAAEIQQKVEMMLLQERERKAPLAPAHKIRATEIQQKLEIMLYKLREQDALESFAKRVPRRVETERSSEESFRKNFRKDLHYSRSVSKSSKGSLEHFE